MDIFNRFKQVLKIRDVIVSNEIFQLHYRVTALLLLSCAALVASKQHFGDPIDCITRDDVPNKIMDTYCWIHSTFTLPNSCNKTVGIEVAHPCVDKYSHDEERVYHKYYQWVYFVLFFQAACFYAPHFAWKLFESKLLCKLTCKLRSPILDERDKKEAELKLICDYLYRNRKRHQQYFYYFTLFEVLNFLNVIMQIYLVDEFLGGTFTNYGIDVINYVQMDQGDRVDPMVKVFPRMTKCTFHRFGSSGDVQTYDALCILPLNIINEKIYIVMWFWFVFLAIITALWLAYRFLTLTRPRVRQQVLARRANLTSARQLRYVLSRLDSGDWFLLSMMCKNMDSQWFRFLIGGLRERLKKMEQDILEAQKCSIQMGRRNHPSNRANNSSAKYITTNGKEPIIESSTSDDDSESDSESELSKDHLIIGSGGGSSNQGDKGDIRPLKEVITSADT